MPPKALGYLSVYHISGLCRLPTDCAYADLRSNVWPVKECIRIIIVIIILIPKIIKTIIVIIYTIHPFYVSYKTSFLSGVMHLHIIFPIRCSSPSSCRHFQVSGTVTYSTSSNACFISQHESMVPPSPHLEYSYLRISCYSML